MGYPWQIALLAVFIEGLVFLVLSLTNVREALFNVIPISLKQAVSVGIGVYIAFIGLQNAGVVVNNDSTLVSLVSFTDDFHASGICALLAIIGIFLTAVLYIKGIKGSILIGILGTWVLGILCQLTGLYTVDAEAGYNSLIPTISMTDFSTLGDTFGQCFHADFDGISIVNFIVVISSFLFVDIFDTLGTLIGVCNKANIAGQGRQAAENQAGSAGVAAGGRTGFSAVITAILFLISMFFAPIFIAIPSFATAPALVIVGFLMFSSITEISFKNTNYLHAIPAYLCVLAMPLFYSISEGISIGIISFVLLHLVCGKGKEVKPLLYVLAMLFLLKYIFL